MIKLLICLSLLLTGCVNNIWTGANLVYDRHNVYIKLADFQLNAYANRALYGDLLFKHGDSHIEIAVFNRDLLMVGYVPTASLLQEAHRRIKGIPGIRRFFDELSVSRIPPDLVQDSWITTKIRSQIFADSNIDPSKFKVVTSNHIVYLMGDVIPIQARQVIIFARQCNGVERVVKLFKYYTLSDHI